MNPAPTMQYETAGRTDIQVDQFEASVQWHGAVESLVKPPDGDQFVALSAKGDYDLPPKTVTAQIRADVLNGSRFHQARASFRSRFQSHTKLALALPALK